MFYSKKTIEITLTTITSQNLCDVFEPEQQSNDRWTMNVAMLLGVSVSLNQYLEKISSASLTGLPIDVATISCSSQSSMSIRPKRSVAGIGTGAACCCKTQTKMHYSERSNMLTTRGGT